MRENEPVHRGELGEQDLARKGERGHHGAAEQKSNNEMYEGRPHVTPLFADNVHMTYRPYGAVL
jgi:hypothetical protein